jgi:hypothetical protein
LRFGWAEQLVPAAVGCRPAGCRLSGKLYQLDGGRLQIQNPNALVFIRPVSGKGENFLPRTFQVIRQEGNAGQAAVMTCLRARLGRAVLPRVV